MLCQAPKDHVILHFAVLNTNPPNQFFKKFDFNLISEEI